jgi:hypothetical protein
MNKEELTEYIATGREIEFVYRKKKYSITYYNDKREDYISFCEFYKDTLDVASADELWDAEYHGFRISEALSSLKEDDIDIY